MSAIQFAVPQVERTAGAPAGVYATRRLSGLRPREAEDGGPEDDEGPLKREGDIKQRQVFTGWTLLLYASPRPRPARC
jgi:hypothetical protein